MGSKQCNTGACNRPTAGSNLYNRIEESHRRAMAVLAASKQVLSSQETKCTANKIGSSTGKSCECDSCAKAVKPAKSINISELQSEKTIDLARSPSVCNPTDATKREPRNRSPNATTINQSINNVLSTSRSERVRGMSAIPTKFPNDIRVPLKLDDFTGQSYMLKDANCDFAKICNRTSRDLDSILGDKQSPCRLSKSMESVKIVDDDDTPNYLIKKLINDQSYKVKAAKAKVGSSESENSDEGCLLESIDSAEFVPVNKCACLAGGRPSSGRRTSSCCPPARSFSCEASNCNSCCPCPGNTCVSCPKSLCKSCDVSCKDPCEPFKPSPTKTLCKPCVACKPCPKPCPPQNIPICPVSPKPALCDPCSPCNRCKPAGDACPNPCRPAIDPCGSPCKSPCQRGKACCDPCRKCDCVKTCSPPCNPPCKICKPACDSPCVPPCQRCKPACDPCRTCSCSPKKCDCVKKCVPPCSPPCKSCKPLCELSCCNPCAKDCKACNQNPQKDYGLIKKLCTLKTPCSLTNVCPPQNPCVRREPCPPKECYMIKDSCPDPRDNCNLKSCSQMSGFSDLSYMNGYLPLKSTHNEVSWASVKLRKMALKSLQIKNTSCKRLIIRVILDGPGFTFENVEANTKGTLTLGPAEVRTVNLQFNPTVLGPAVGNLIFQPPIEFGNGQMCAVMSNINSRVTKRVIRLYGYGGHVSISFEQLQQGPVGLKFLPLGNLCNLAKVYEKSFVVRNKGNLTAFMAAMQESKVIGKSSFDCSITICPERALIPPNGTVHVKVTFTPTAADMKTMMKIHRNDEVITIGTLLIYTGDEPTRCRAKRLILCSCELQERYSTPQMRAIWADFPPCDCDSSDLCGIRETEMAIPELFQAFQTKEVALTINNSTADMSMIDASGWISDCEEAAVVFHTICQPNENSPCCVSPAEGDCNMRPLDIREANLSFGDQGEEYWTVDPKELVFDLGDTLPKTLTIKACVKRDKMFEVDSNVCNYFSVSPQEGVLRPSCQNTVISVRLLNYNLPNTPLFVYIYLDNDRICIPVSVCGQPDPCPPSCNTIARSYVTN